MSWPKEVPVLEARHITRHQFDSNDGKRHCLLGWRNTVFGDSPIQCSKVDEALAKAVKEAVGWDANPIVYNDNWSVPKTKIAKVWNRAMEILGYTEDVCTTK